MATITEKPTTELYRPELTRLPPLTWWQNVKRVWLKRVAWLLMQVFIRITVIGREYFPTEGPMLMVSNHLGDADGVIGLAIAKAPFDVMGKIELYDVPVLGRVMEWYGTIWVHRGLPDRRALRATLDGLVEDRMIAIAPEGRESVTGGLEEGTDGAAYIALKADVPILPVVFIGTENWRVFGNLKRLRRTQVLVKAGPPFHLTATGDRRADIREGTLTIMKALARLLPPEYRGAYRDAVEEEHGDT